MGGGYIGIEKNLLTGTTTKGAWYLPKNKRWIKIGRFSIFF